MFESPGNIKSPANIELKSNVEYLMLRHDSPNDIQNLIINFCEKYDHFKEKSASGIFVIAVGGAEATAKTYLVNEFKKLLRDRIHIIVLAMDDYLKLSRKERKEKVDTLRERGTMSDEDLLVYEIGNAPSLTDFESLKKNINELKEGKPIIKNIYNHTDGNIIKNREEVGPVKEGILFVEGIFALKDELDGIADLNIFVYSAEEKKSQRVARRDSVERGHGDYLANKYFLEAQIPSYRRHIEPTIKNADVIIDTTNLFD